MKLIESIKLRHRANKYKNKDDIGGIAYINSSIKKGQTVLDIGAHKAGYLYFMLKQVGDKGKVFAFEPQSNLYQYIKKIKGLFGWDNATIEHLALSDSAGTVTLYIPTNKVSKASSPGATIVEHKDRSDFWATEDVATETLDSYCNRHNIKPDFLKIDVEGNELRIFQGGVDTLKKYKPKIIVEIEARHVGQEKVVETFKFMESLGYNGHFLHGLDRIPLTNFSFDKYQNTNDMKNYCNNFTFE
ncbi:MAG: FkbM family methyltransferase [Bacteroidetes bacterium]|jgi:FkbM family methyltransferase|nr:FkbM family methyltransferase [Bacteroidota bacterium]